jgi:hypothetical protein
MSHLSPRPEQSTTAETDLLTALNNLTPSSTEAIVKNPDGTFSTIPVTASGLNIETPSGVLDGNNVTFVATHTPKFIVTSNGVYFEGVGYTLAGLTITLSLPPSAVADGGFIRSFY